MDQDLNQAYRLLSPSFLVKKRAQKAQKLSAAIYGETPLVTYEAIANAVSLQPTDLFLELGCGRGRGALFIAHFYQCSVIGIDWVDTFIDIANALVQDYHMPKISFLAGDYFTLDWGNPTVIYLFGTTLSDEDIRRLIPRFLSYPTSRIVTVSFPLSHYSDQFHIEKFLTGEYPWGQTEIYINRVNA